MKHREAAKLRYLSEEKQFSYYHNIMSEYFLGTYGGGKPKPFKYTEIQRHRYKLIPYLRHKYSETCCSSDLASSLKRHQRTDNCQSSLSTSRPSLGSC